MIAAMTRAIGMAGETRGGRRLGMVNRADRVGGNRMTDQTVTLMRRGSISQSCIAVYAVKGVAYLSRAVAAIGRCVTQGTGSRVETSNNTATRNRMATGAVTTG